MAKESPEANQWAVRMTTNNTFENYITEQVCMYVCMYVCMSHSTTQLDDYERCMGRSSNKTHCKLHAILNVGIYDKFIDEW